MDGIQVTSLAAEIILPCWLLLYRCLLLRYPVQRGKNKAKGLRIILNNDYASIVRLISSSVFVGFPEFLSDVKGELEAVEIFGLDSPPAAES